MGRSFVVDRKVLVLLVVLAGLVFLAVPLTTVPTVLVLNYGQVVKYDGADFWKSSYGVKYQIPDPYSDPPPSFVSDREGYFVLYTFHDWLKNWKAVFEDRISYANRQIADLTNNRERFVSELVSFGKSRAEAEAYIDSLIEQYREQASKLQSLVSAVTQDLFKVRQAIVSWGGSPPEEQKPKMFVASVGWSGGLVVASRLEQVSREFVARLNENIASRLSGMGYDVQRVETSIGYRMVDGDVAELVGTTTVWSYKEIDSSAVLQAIRSVLPNLIREFGVEASQPVQKPPVPPPSKPVRTETYWWPTWLTERVIILVVLVFVALILIYRGRGRLR
jgi:hypothetical protein